MRKVLPHHDPNDMPAGKRCSASWEYARQPCPPNNSRLFGAIPIPQPPASPSMQGSSHQVRWGAYPEKRAPKPLSPAQKAADKLQEQYPLLLSSPHRRPKPQGQRFPVAGK